MVTDLMSNEWCTLDIMFIIVNCATLIAYLSSFESSMSDSKFEHVWCLYVFMCVLDQVTVCQFLVLSSECPVFMWSVIKPVIKWKMHLCTCSLHGICCVCLLMVQNGNFQL